MRAVAVALSLFVTSGVAVAEPPVGVDAVAHDLAASPGVLARVHAGLAAASKVDLAPLAEGALRQRVDQVGAHVRASKQLPASLGPLLQVRAGNRVALTSTANALVVAEPTSDEVAFVTAYSRGGAQRISVDAPPTDRPLFVVAVDRKRVLAANLAKLRASLRALGVRADEPSAAGGYDAAKITSIRLAKDHEPNLRGDAEIYTLVAGVGPDNKPVVDTVQMPYLDHDKTTYTPNQVLVNWSHFKYAAADAVMMEEDDNFSWEELARAAAKAILAVAGAGEYIPVVDAILAAVPDSFWTNDADYVDSWYTIRKDSVGAVRTLNGARANGVLTLNTIHVPST
ncbi:DUF3103 domain-containing protein [Allokutzneria sp. A3M-2-11 16]|uniref:DUF3103 family protein n=1 Tax=Allokutzneria sp. A3M-2-11 16 TaxID=2962043 RepID=UPI0020B7E2FC|nr:DUF3103 family protein [Allokutzneria sp. A3M-2-11 16]MCP3805561.1 DUF3103 domain-containing protein [Allokutzneria sp. A3M-2-11 16]